MFKHLNLKSLFLFMLMIFVVDSVSAQTWSDAVIAAKKEMASSLDKAGMPIMSEVMKKSDPAAKISADVTGLDYIVLYTWGTEDGSDYDHAVWADAKFITEDGKVVYLDDMTFSHGSAGWGSPIRGKDLNGKTITVKGKKYTHGLFVHANGEVVVVLDKKYERFESEVGVNDTGNRRSSVIFKIQNISGREEAGKLIAKYPTQIGAFVQQSKVTSDVWLTSKDASIEKKALGNVINNLKDKSYFTSEISKVSGSNDEQMKAYMALFEQAVDILALQNELQWIDAKNIRRAFDNMKSMKGYDAAKYEAKMKELEVLCTKDLNAIYKNDKQAIADVKNIVALKRDILMSNPMLDVDKIIVGRYKLGDGARNAMAPSLGTQANNWSNQMSAQRLGFDAEIAELSDLKNPNVTVKTIYKPEEQVAVSDLHLHWNADRLMFSSLNERGLWGVFEVKTDGSGLKELVVMPDDPDLEFFDGCYLPSGKVIANSNIGYQGVPCVDGSDPVGNMVLFDPNEKGIRRLTFDQDANWNPIVMNNGRVMYVRWEYTDLTHYFSRIVMHMNPDGTEVKALYGSGSFFPNSTFDVQPLPGNTSAFVGIVSGHHGIARSGRLMIFDPAKGRKEVSGIVQEMPFSTRPIEPLIKDELVNDVWPQFVKPYPINDKYFLVSAKLTPESLWGIYLVDIYDNMTLIAESEGEGFVCPIIVQKRPTPPIIPDRVKLDETEATVFIQDIYEGEGLPDVPRGTVKELRVFAYEYAYIQSPSNHAAQGIQSGWDIKRLLGNVPVEEDGSVIFKIPANTPISLQPLDSEGRALQWMRSWLTGMPGEVVSCIGCHEDQNSIPVPKKVIASAKSPDAIKAPEGGTRPFTFELEVQPVLTRACVACHDGKNGGMNLTGGRTDQFTNFGMSYLAIHPFVNRQGPEADAYVMKPYEYHASTSELVRILKDGHHGVELTDNEWRTIYSWIDMNAPYHSTFKQRDLKGYNQIDRRMELAKKYNNLEVDWQDEIRNYTDYLASKGEIVPVKPKEVKAPVYKEVKAKGWPFTAEEASAKQSAEKEVTKKVEIVPGVVMKFRRIPAGSFVMGNNNKGGNVAPETPVKIAKAFWIGELEVTNEQFRAFYPEHDSRYIAQFWKDHTGPGYPANHPGQPVIRLSYDQAEAFCKKLSEKTGLSVSLPTEAQWEWACRAGSNSDFWFGNMNTDFATFDNMADAQLSNMAVAGVNPQPMDKSNPWFKYYNFIPKSEGIDDGNMLLVEGGQYQANPWGLYDMHGNVEEWTRSDYIPYPYSDKSKLTGEFKVVRGGSWIDRAKNSTSYTRKAYYPWQIVNNVGFRVVIEE